MRNHPRALENEGISPERYKELRAICEQYPEYVRLLRRARAGLEERPNRKGGRGGAWRRPDPTGNVAVEIVARYSWYSDRIALIEGCARAVAGNAVAPALIECVTEGRNFDILRKRPPCGRRNFYKLRLLFFILLDARLREG